MKIKKLNESSLVDKKVSTLGKAGKPMYFTDDQLKDAKGRYPEYDFEETTIDKSLPQGQKAYIAKKKVTEDVQHCWFGYYISAMTKEKKYFYMTKDVAGKDPDYAAEYMEDSIPEPFTKFVFCGSIANTQAEKQDMKLVEAKQVKVFGAKAKKLNEAEEILYVIKDSHGNQLSRPTPDDDELWDRVASMEARGRRGLCVVVYTGKKECLSESDDVQYGVHSFSQDAIIFRGTEEECGRYIDSHKELWDDAEVYRMEPNDSHYKKMDEAAEYKVKFFQVFESPKSPKDSGKMIGQRGTLDAANAFGKEKAGEGNYIIKAVCDDGVTRPIDNDTESDAYQMVNESIDVATIADYITDHYEFDDIDDKYGCINSIRDSFKDEKTISYEVLNQFIGAHNGRDKVEEALTEDKGQPRSKRYTTYFNRIKRAIEKGDEETLQRTKEAIMYAPAKELKNSEASELMDMIKNRKINEASYGGAYDIADDQYFTRDDLNSFADEVLGHVSETFNGSYDVGGVWFEDGNVITQIVDADGSEFEDTTKVDMRKIREPWHLKRMYAFPVAANIIKQIEENDADVITENVRGMGEYSDKFYDYLDHLSNESDAGGIEYLASQLIRYCKEEDLKDLWFDRMNKVAQDNGFGVDDVDESKKLKEDFDEEQVLRDAQRWFDVEIPDVCKDVLDNLHTWPAYRVSYMNKLAKDFYNNCARYSLQVRESLDEDVETPVLSAPTEGPESGLASLLNTAMQDELKTIQMYNDVSVTAKAEGFEEIAAQIDEINTEENKHVGQLQEMLKTIAPNAQAIDAGELEAGDALVTVEEKINNSTETPNNNSEDIKEAVIMEGTERWKEIYQSFKNVEQELDGDGEAITAVIDRMYQDNKDDPDYKLAYDKWASNE